jgi:hypothetical protein
MGRRSTKMRVRVVELEGRLSGMAAVDRHPTWGMVMSRTDASRLRLGLGTGARFSRGAPRAGM